LTSAAAERNASPAPHVFGVELTSERSNSAQSAAASPLTLPQREDVQLASSTTSLLVSPQRQGSPPSDSQRPVHQSKAVRMQLNVQEERVPRASWEAQQQRLNGATDDVASPPLVPNIYRPALHSEGGVPPQSEAIDGGLQEYVVPAGRRSQTIPPSSASPTAADDQTPSSPNNPLRSYSHRSLFRPPREDVDAVRRLASNMSSMVVGSPVSRPPPPVAQPLQSSTTTTWC
jgi:hypothetical protein